jgi:hypothetical protein
MYPHERSLVKKMQGKPFALIGVNSDPNREAIKPDLQRERITWRSFWNGPRGTDGAIADKWKVDAWPTIYLIDHEGVIRHKYLGAPEGDELDRAIDKLVAEVPNK